MRWARLAVLGLAAAAAIVSPTAGAPPARTHAELLIDCTCYDIYRVATDRAPRAVLKNNGQNLFDVSRDRTRIVYARDALYTARITGAAERKLGAGYIREATISPNGRQVAYVADGCGLCVVGIDGRNRHLLGIANAGGPVAWSPDSRRLAFVVYREPHGDEGALTIARPDGSAARTLTPPRSGFGGGTSIGAKLAWSPQGDRIAYLAFPARIHVVRIRDGSDRALARGRSPVWSPDGRWIAFLREGTRPWRTAVMDAKGAHVHVLDPLAVDPYGFGVAWSPRGRWIAYPRVNARGRYELGLARPDGTHRRRLTREGKDVEIGPIYWSRDGETILYTRYLQQGE